MSEIASAPNPIPSSEERNWALATHVSAFAVFIIPGIGGMLGPLIVWLLKKDQMQFVNDQGRESLNFQITIFIFGVIGFMLLFVLIGFPLLIALYIFNMVCIIIGTVKASEGVTYRYPINFRLIK
jgi:uncharacterized Tic20 family protein